MPVVGLNLLWLVPGVVGGSEEYTLRLLRAVDRIDPDDVEIRLYTQPGLLAVHPDLADRFETVMAPRVVANKLVRLGADLSWLAHVSRGDDLVHHAGSVVPPTTPKPYVFTVHDLQPLDHPENFSMVKRRFLANRLPPSIEEAALVLTPSRFSADAVQRHTGIDEARVRVVPHGHEAVEPGPNPDDVAEKLRRRFGRYVLFPAIAYPHKRHVDLLDAIALLDGDAGDVSVVFTGGPGPETQHLLDHASELGIAHRVHHLGRVPESELDALYRSALSLVFPSMYEGFGNPPLEAMARACPVIATTAASIPEVVGDAALLVEPCDPVGLAEAMRTLAGDAAERARLGALGPPRAERFGWLAAGEALLDAYRDAAEAAS